MISYNSLLELGLGYPVSCDFDKLGCGVRYNALVSSERNTFKAAPIKKLQLMRVAGSIVLRIRGIEIDEISGWVFGRNTEEVTDASYAWDLMIAVFLSYGMPLDNAERNEASYRNLIHDHVLHTRATEAQLTETMTWLSKLEQEQELSESLLCEDFKAGYNEKQISEELLSFGSISPRPLAALENPASMSDQATKSASSMADVFLREAGVIDLLKEHGNMTVTQAYQLIEGQCNVDGLEDGITSKTSESRMIRPNTSAMDSEHDICSGRRFFPDTLYTLCLSRQG